MNCQRCNRQAYIRLTYTNGDKDSEYYCSRECLAPRMIETKDRDDRFISLIDE